MFSVSPASKSHTANIAGDSFVTPSTLNIEQKPAIYSGNFASCLGEESPVSIDKLNVAYYDDESALVLQLAGTSKKLYDSIKLNLTIHAYDKDRLSLLFDACEEGLTAFCPLKTNSSFEMSSVISLSSEDFESIRKVANDIPDFDGYARLSILDEPTGTQIGCNQADVTTGQTLSHPRIIGTVLFLFTILAAVASWMTAIYGVSIPYMRTHYAHSVSVLFILEAFHSIFLTGAISVDFPAILPAWWSNFAWSLGMVPSDALIRALSNSAGVANHPVSEIGDLGGNINRMPQQLYDEFNYGISVKDGTQRPRFGSFDGSAYTWGGIASICGLTLPGSYLGLTGTLSKVGMPPPTTAMLGLVWLTVAAAIVFAFVCLVKGLLELGAKLKIIKGDGFGIFRKHYLGYGAIAISRTLLIALFPVATLSCFQLTLRSHPGPTTVATILLVTFILFLGGLSFYFYYSRLSAPAKSPEIALGEAESGGLSLAGQHAQAARRRENIRVKNGGSRTQSQEKTSGESKKLVKPATETIEAHSDGSIRKFGWLYARYRRTRWWFFALALTFRFLRGVFLGSANGSPKIQISGLLTLDVVYLILLIILKPNEGNRNQAMAIMRSVSNVVCTSLTIGLLPELELENLYVQIIGYIIVIVQGFLTLAVLLLILTSVVSTGFSLSRNKECWENLDKVRVRYLEHLKKDTNDYRNCSDIPAPEPEQPVADGAVAQAEALQEAIVQADDLGSVRSEDTLRPETPPRQQIEKPTQALTHETAAREIIHRHSVHESVPAGPRQMPRDQFKRPLSLHIPQQSWKNLDTGFWDAASVGAEGKRMSHRQSLRLKMQARSLQRTSRTPETVPKGPRPGPVSLAPTSGEGGSSNEDVSELDLAVQATAETAVEDQPRETSGYAGTEVLAKSTSSGQDQSLLTVPVKTTFFVDELPQIECRPSWLSEFKAYYSIFTEEDEGEDEGALADETARDMPTGRYPQSSEVPADATAQNDIEGEDALKIEDLTGKVFMGPRPQPEPAIPRIVVSEAGAW